MSVAARPTRTRTWLLVALLVAAAVRVPPILATERPVADVARYARVATHLLDVSPNPYATRGLYPYPPVWAAFEAGAEWLARRGLGRFEVLVKLPPLAADLAIVGLLAALAAAGAASPLAPWLYALHPVSVLVTAFHGQFDALALAFVLVALEAARRGRADLSALALAGGIAFKSFPVLLVPLLAVGPGVGLRHASRYALLATAPVALLLLPFALADPAALRRELAGYGGVADFGWIGLVRGVDWLATGRLVRSEARYWPAAVAVAKVLFLAAWAALVVAVARGRLRLSPAACSLAALLAFQLFYGALSAQYLLWVVPLAALSPGRALAAYTTAATLALVGFYPFLAPGVLTPEPLSSEAARVAGGAWVAGVGLVLVVCAAWLVSLLHGGRSAARLAAQR